MTKEDYAVVVDNPKLLLQDCSRRLGAWFATRLDAKAVVRRGVIPEHVPASIYFIEKEIIDETPNSYHA